MFFNPADLQDDILRHEQFDASFELLPTGANNAANSITVGNTVAVGIPGQDNPTVENLTSADGYPIALFTVTARSNAAVTLRYIGVSAKAAAAAAATTAAAAAFGPRLGAAVTVPRARFPYHLRAKPTHDNLVGMLMAPVESIRARLSHLQFAVRSLGSGSRSGHFCCLLVFP